LIGEYLTETYGLCVNCFHFVPAIASLAWISVGKNAITKTTEQRCFRHTAKSCLMDQRFLSGFGLIVFAALHGGMSSGGYYYCILYGWRFLDQSVFGSMEVPSQVFDLRILRGSLFLLSIVEKDAFTWFRGFAWFRGSC